MAQAVRWVLALCLLVTTAVCAEEQSKEQEKDGLLGRFRRMYPYTSSPKSTPHIIYGYTTDSGSRGSISSPNWPYTYPNNHVFYHQIGTTYGLPVRLEFRAFDIQKCGTNCSCDSVTVTDPTVQFGRKFCGSSLPEGNGVIFGVTPMTVEFKSDAYIIGNGYIAEYTINYSASPQLPTMTSPLPTSPPTKHYMFTTDTARTDTITSPNYPGTYSSNTDDFIQIGVTFNKLITIHFTHFDLQQCTNCSCDSLTVTSNSGDYRKQKFCGNNLPNTNGYVYAYSPATIEFSSDSSLGLSGFSATYVEETVNPTPYTGWTNNKYPINQPKNQGTTYYPQYTTKPYSYYSTYYPWGTTQDYPPQSTQDYPPQSTHYYPWGTTKYYPPQSTQYYPPYTTKNYPPQSTQNYPPQSTQYYPPQSTQYYPWGTTQYYPPQSTQYYPPQSTHYYPPQSTHYYPPQSTQYHPPQSTQYHPPQSTPYYPPYTTQYYPPYPTQPSGQKVIPKSFLVQLLRQLDNKAIALQTEAGDLARELETVLQWVSSGNINNYARRSASLLELLQPEKTEAKPTVAVDVAPTEHPVVMETSPGPSHN